MILPGSSVARHLSSYTKINPNGVDVAPKKIYRLPDDAEIYLEGKKRGFLRDGKFIPLTEALQEIKSEGDFWVLEPGRYYVVFPEIEIPLDVVGFAYPRSTFNRLGIIKSQTAVFDPGYKGEWNHTFWIPVKARIHVSEAWVHVVFIRNEGTTGKYEGFWQGEKY
jgi:deoxycytidine triphosphate deaminase